MITSDRNANINDVNTRSFFFRADREAVVFVSRRRRGFVSGGPGNPKGWREFPFRPRACSQGRKGNSAPIVARRFPATPAFVVARSAYPLCELCILCGFALNPAPRGTEFSLRCADLYSTILHNEGEPGVSRPENGRYPATYSAGCLTSPTVRRETCRSTATPSGKSHRKGMKSRT